MFYDVVNDDNYTNGFFDLQINWITSDIIGEDKENSGFIVQKIKRTTSASPEFMNSIRNKDDFEHEYYEAWKVENGAVILDKDLRYHDQWYYGGKLLSDLKKKYGTQGSVKMSGMVYWINQKMPEYSSVNEKFKKRGIKHAGELLSTAEFAEAEYLHPVCHREKVGTWDFMEDEKYIKAFIECAKQFGKMGQELIDYIESSDVNMPLSARIIEAINSEKY